MAWLLKTSAYILGFLILVGGIVLSIILFINLRNTERQTAQNELDLNCGLITGYTSSLLWGTVTLMISLVEMIRRGGWIGQNQMALILKQMTALPWESIGMAELQLIPGTEIVDWQRRFNASVTTVDSVTFQQIPLSLNRSWYLPLSSCVPCQAAIGLDYFGEYYRSELVQRAVRTNKSTISYPIQTSTVTSTGQTVRALVFFTPFFNNSNNNAFEGGVSSSYDSEHLINRNRTQSYSFAMEILNTTVFEDPTYAATALKHNSTFVILDQTLTLSCGRDFSGSMTPWIVLVLGVFLSLLVPLIILLSAISNRKQKAATLRESSIREEQRAAILREQAAISVSEMKSSFLATMSHEIRTPINGIIGMIDLVMDTEMNNRQRDYMETIRESAWSLLSIINDILDFSKIEAGKLLVDIIDCNLPSLLVMITRAAEPLASVNTNIFTVHHDLPDFFTIKTDPHRLRQIINNLLSNAFKFTNQGSVDLYVQIENGQYHDGSEGPIVHFSISDTGIGMSSDVLENLFKPFAQADASTTRKYGGTGLGLSISKRLVNLLNGDIWAESQEGVGSVFHFSIPYIRGDSNKGKEYEERIIKGSGLILAVDDNNTNLKVANGVLKKLGYDVINATNGQEAIDTYYSHENEIKAIMMDCQMPIMDGYEATRKLRESGVKIPIIAMTADVQAQNIQKCIDCGMNDYITKPMSFSKLSILLEKYIGGHAVPL